ncbi:acetyl-CoA carboxylase biotin carboxylase subunit [Gordonia sp. PDNC005]|uniref:acetyl-CoA carboxylase biotin carboxylase subunit n=1 Tax=unclassified Gordonia (in: high G+C Gram-positive bacteria) TaxID=2657482 RepID=UPI0019661D09|nr:acetyl-CoA carboxylase biotin carboxylase subunit [Gordonia sp. PDNC005]QRY61161.1 acetyl-CoA carboxylase biotin carboxylase subunit [Gordonia sp. PDNC005]
MQKLLIANRGEIAVRIIRAARELDITTVAIYSEADEHAEHVRLADEAVCVGPAQATASYLNISNVLAAIESSGADAVHPGYGFMSENADFAQAVVDAGAVWVGPAAQAIRDMGDKVSARRSAKAADVNTVPGSAGELTDPDEAVAVAADIGFPLAIKASAGGGGRGIRIVEQESDLIGAIKTAKAEARAAFGNDAVYIERFIPRARHIEVQVFGDGVRAVHLGMRDCSVQRRRQKVVEEAGQLFVTPEVGQRMCDAAVRLAEAVQYQGAGTVEFLYDEQRNDYYFLEMNTRIQVEHPVTEMVFGEDLVAEQLRVAAGQPLSFVQESLVPRGHAIEIRLNAENADMNFLPSPGTLEKFALPGGPFVRLDSGVVTGSVISPYYDSMLAKIIVWGATRDLAVARMLRALGELDVQGIVTTAPFVETILRSPDFASGAFHTTWLEKWMADRAEAGAA